MHFDHVILLITEILSSFTHYISIAIAIQLHVDLTLLYTDSKDMQHVIIYNLYS